MTRLRGHSCSICGWHSSWLASRSRRGSGPEPEGPLVRQAAKSLVESSTRPRGREHPTRRPGFSPEQSSTLVPHSQGLHHVLSPGRAPRASRRRCSLEIPINPVPINKSETGSGTSVVAREMLPASPKDGFLPAVKRVLGSRARLDTKLLVEESNTGGKNGFFFVVWADAISSLSFTGRPVASRP